MKAPQWVRLLVLAFAFMSVVGVMAAVACGPSAPLAPPNGAGNVSDGVSAPATGSPFVVPQSGDGGGTAEPTTEPTAEPTEEPTDEPTEEPTPTQYVPPTTDPSLCKGTGSHRYCPPDGDPKLEYRVRGHYNYAMQQNAARGVRGDAREFPELDLFITTRTADAVDEVAEFLRSNGVRLRYTALYKKPDGSRGSVKARVNLSLLPQLVAIESVKWVHEDRQRKNIELGTGDFDWNAVDDDLWTLYESTKRENNARRTRGEEALPDPVVRVRIKIDSSSAVDGVLRHLRSNGGENVVWKKVERSTGDPNGSGTVEADVDIWVVAGMMWFHGVQEIKEIQERSKVPAGWHSGFGGSAGRDVVEPPLGPSSSVVAMQADQWHRAGYTGAGVEVAVIDVGFREFKTQVLPFLSVPVRYLCHSSAYSNPPPAEGILYPDGTELDLEMNPTDGFFACAFFSGHGTAAAASLIENAPDVKLYVSNPSDDSERAMTMDWLTAGVGDFDVKVISHSTGAEWDGPGDGSSPFDEDEKRSLLNTVKGAVKAGVLWVNAAGNDGAVTWFKYDPTFTSGNDRLLDFNGSGQICNRFRLSGGRNYSIQLRSSGSWPGADIDLDLLLYPASGSPSNPLGMSDGVNGGTDTQSGSDGSGEEDPHYPLEVLEVRSGMLTSGHYCLAVRLNSGSGSRSVTELPSELASVPVAGLDWVQLQILGSKYGDDLRQKTLVGSLTNPAESSEDGMLSVGFVYPVDGVVDRRSARGPGPWERNRQALDLVSDGTHPFVPHDGAVAGSSGAAPRVAGLAALVIQALGDRDEFDSPAEIAQYMKEYGSTRLDCVHDWGCGFAILPPIDPPENLMLEATSGICGRPFPDNVGVTFDRVASKNPDVAVPYYFVEARKVGDADADSLDLAGSSSNNRNSVHLPGGETYVADIRTCLPGVSGEPVCGKASISSNELPVPREVCRPTHFDVIPGQGIITLRWDAQLGAEEYVVERVVDGVGVEGSGGKVTDQHYVFTDVPRSVLQYYRVRAVGPSGDSSWSNTFSNHTGNDLGFVWTPRVFQEYPFRNRLGEYDAVFGWLYGGGAALQDVQVRKVGTEAWTLLSSDPEVASDGPRVIFTREVYQGGNFGSSNMYGALTGLVPGTEYQIRVRGVNGDRVSAWTGTANFTTPGRRPAEGTDRPPVPAGLQVMVNAVQPFPRVVLGWDAGAEDYLHEIRIMGGGLATWGRLPHQLIGWSSEYSVLYPTDGQAFIIGLIPRHGVPVCGACCKGEELQQ